MIVTARSSFGLFLVAVADDDGGMNLPSKDTRYGHGLSSLKQAGSDDLASSPIRAGPLGCAAFVRRRHKGPGGVRQIRQAALLSGAAVGGGTVEITPGPTRGIIDRRHWLTTSAAYEQGRFGPGRPIGDRATVSEGQSRSLGTRQAAQGLGVRRPGARGPTGRGIGALIPRVALVRAWEMARGASERSDDRRERAHERQRAPQRRSSNVERAGECSATPASAPVVSASRARERELTLARPTRSLRR